MCRLSYFSERINRLSRLIKAGLSLEGSTSTAITVSCRLQMPIPGYQMRVLSEVSRCSLTYCWCPWLSCPFTIHLHNALPGYSSHSEVLKWISLALMIIQRTDKSHGYGWWHLTTKMVVCVSAEHWWLNSLCKCCIILQNVSTF